MTKFLNLSNDSTFESNSPYIAVSEKAVKGAMNLKADKSDTYTKSQVYTKTEVDTIVENIVIESGLQPNLTSSNAGTGISITGSGSNVVISNTQTSAEWGNVTGTLSNQTDLQNALNAKQGTLTFDSTPTSGSSNPVTSGGIYTALNAKQDVATAVHKIDQNTISKNVNLQPINTVVNVEGTGYTNSPQGDSSFWNAGVSLKVGKDDYYTTSGDWLRGWYLYGQWNNNPNLWYGTRATASDPSSTTLTWRQIPLLSTTSWDIISKKSYTLGTSPSSEIDGGIQIRDSNNAEISTIGHKTFSNGHQYVLLSSIKKSGNSTYSAIIRCGVDENNNVYTEAPTPAASDNSSKIATTKFVKNQGYIGSGNLATCHVIVETYRNGTSWYRVYDDGWVEQGGRLERGATGIQNVTFLKNFADLNYNIQATNRAAESYTSASTFYPPYTLKHSVTGFSMSSNAAIANIKYFEWVACGMGA